MLAEYCPHCRKKKKDYKCKRIANVDSKKIPLEFKMIEGDEEQVFYVAQRRPWAPRQGMPPDPLSFSGPYMNSYASNNQWQHRYPSNFWGVFTRILE